MLGAEMGLTGHFRLAAPPRLICRVEWAPIVYFDEVAGISTYFHCRVDANDQWLVANEEWLERPLNLQPAARVEAMAPGAVDIRESPFVRAIQTQP